MALTLPYCISRTGRFNGWEVVGGQCCGSGSGTFLPGRIRNGNNCTGSALFYKKFCIFLANFPSKWSNLSLFYWFPQKISKLLKSLNNLKSRIRTQQWTGSPTSNHPTCLWLHNLVHRKQRFRIRIFFELYSGSSLSVSCPLLNKIPYPLYSNLT